MTNKSLLLLLCEIYCENHPKKVLNVLKIAKSLLRDHTKFKKYRMLR